MPAITFGGINSGLPPNIVDQLMDAERIPIRQLEEKINKSDSQLKLVQDLEDGIIKIKGSISELAGTKGFSDIQLISGDPNIVQGVIDPELANPGSWNIEVIQLAQKAAAVTNGFPDKDRTELGVGYFSFETPTGKKEVYINGNNNTLEKAAQAINNAQMGIRATVINDRKDKEAPFRLVLSGENVGDDNQIKYPTLYFLDGDQDIYFEEERSAQNGIIKLDGFEMEISDNNITDLIPGVTIQLKQASPGRSVNVTVKEDIEAVSGKIKDFVEAMNKTLGFIQTQNKLDEHTDTTKTLGGDSLLRSIEMRLRKLILTPQIGVASSVKQLNQLGISFNRNGTLDFDQEKFHAVLAKNPANVQSFFAGDGFSIGFIPSLKNEVGVILNQAFGPIANRKRGLQQKISQMNSRIQQKESQLVKTEENLRKKFSQLEQTMSRLKSQGGALGSMMSAASVGGLNLSGASTGRQG